MDRVDDSRAAQLEILNDVARIATLELIDDVRTDPNYVETLPGARSELCVPVCHHGGIVAVLNLESTRLAGHGAAGAGVRPGIVVVPQR